MPAPTPVFETSLPLPLWRRGKVRDVYELGDLLLIVASDRLSAFDVVLPTPIPDKGAVLTQLSRFWFEQLRGRVSDHVAPEAVEEVPELGAHAALLRGRSMLVLRTRPLPVECVVRGYLAGSGLKEYRATGTVCGIRLPAGLAEGSRLEAPIFTPATKAESGHDENIGFEQLAQIVGQRRAEQLRELSLDLYREASAHAESRGILLADTKFEFGERDGELVWIDEALTPDSSRFWPRDGWRPGGPQPSFDKQYVRDYLETLDWDKRPPGPALPGAVVEQTRARYVEAFVRLTGRAWPVEAP